MGWTKAQKAAAQAKRDTKKAADAGPTDAPAVVAEPETQSPTRAHWTVEDEKVLLSYLIQHRAEAGDGANFKDATFTGAAEVLAPLTTKGVLKDAKACKNKWGSTLKHTFEVVRKIRNQSGWTWSDTTGASIDDTSASVWEQYLVKNPQAKPFRNRGWVHYEDMVTLMPAQAKGAHVFHAGGRWDPELIDPALRESSDEMEEHDDEPMSQVPSKRRSVSISTPAPTPPTAAPLKKPRLNPAAASIYALNNTIGAFTTTISNSLNGTSDGLRASPLRKQAAIDRAQDIEDDLSDNEVSMLCEVFEKDTSAADTYLSLKRSGVRKAWVNRRLFPDE